MDPKAQDGNEASADELTEEQLDQVIGGIAKIGVGVTIDCGCTPPPGRCPH
jgi:bacteriocin-like protein